MTAMYVIIGAIIGGFVGVLIGRSNVCSSSHCTIRNRMIPSIVAGALCGALLAYRLATR